MRIWAVIPAAGVGKRFSSDIPKQYLPLSGIPVLLHSINKLLKFGHLERPNVSVKRLVRRVSGAMNVFVMHY